MLFILDVGLAVDVVEGSGFLSVGSVLGLFDVC